MSRQISILLGSGFSAPDGIMTVGQINHRLQNLKLEDIYIHSDMTFMLLDGQKKPEPSLHHIDEKFFVEFIKFYTKLTGSTFNYEEFYDFVISFGRFGNKKTEIEKFVSDFNSQIPKGPFQMDAVNHLSKFSEYFSKLISSLLQSKKYYEDVGLGNYPPYDSFISYLKYLLTEKYVVTTHSLNHDLLFEHIASKHTDLFSEFTDGFSDTGSSYYGQVHLNQSINKTYKVRLKCFQNLFDKPLRLVKLHGSVDTYIANIFSDNLDLTRVKRDWGVGEIIKETTNSKTGKAEYIDTFQFTYPDILSGATSKATWYKEPYYKDLIEMFKSNLSQSEKLIVIGYGFKDDGINHILETEYLTTGKPMVVIDIKTPNSRLVRDYRVDVIEKSIKDVTIKEWTEL